MTDGSEDDGRLLCKNDCRGAKPLSPMSCGIRTVASDTFVVRIPGVSINNATAVDVASTVTGFPGMVTAYARR